MAVVVSGALCLKRLMRHEGGWGKLGNTPLMLSPAPNCGYFGPLRWRALLKVGGMNGQLSFSGTLLASSSLILKFC